MADAVHESNAHHLTHSKSAIWKLTALPRSEFDATYGVLIDRVVGCIDQAPAGGWPLVLCSETGSGRAALLRQVHGALRLRQSRILPRGASIEAASRLAEAMSFALAVAMCVEFCGQLLGGTQLEQSSTRWCPLIEPPQRDAAIRALEPIPRSYGLLLVTQLVGEAGLRWLTQEALVITALLGYFDEHQPNELRQLALQAAVQSGDAVSAPTESRAAQGAHRNELALRPVKTSVPVATTTKTPAAASSADVVLSQARLDALSVQAKGASTPRGWVFVEWLRSGIAAERISVNAEDSFVHMVEEGGVLVVVPKAFEVFSEQHAIAPKTAQNQVVRLGLHRMKPNGHNLFSVRIAGIRKQALVLREQALQVDTQHPVSDQVSRLR